MKLPKEIISKFPKINLRNADPKKVKEILFIFYGILLVSTIYHVVYAKRIINCSAEKRGKINELLIINYRLPI